MRVPAEDSGRADSEAEESLGWGKRIVATALGWFFVASAISVLIRLGLGVAPYDVLSTAIGEGLGISPGTGMWITGLVFVGVGWIIGARPGIGTVAGFFGIGAMVNALLRVIPEITDEVAKLGVVVPTLLILYTGVCLVIVSNVGAGPTEVLMMALHKKGLRLSWARWGVEALCAVLGGTLGGEIGVLTVVIVVVAGPCIELLLPRTARVLKGSGKGN